MSKPKRLNKHTLRAALASSVKAGTGRKDITFDSAPKVAEKTIATVPIEKRGGFPVKLAEGTWHPKDWVTHGGVKIEVDFGRQAWLPDDWGQGIKATTPTAHSVGGGGGILTAFVSPDRKVYYHKDKVEEYVGRSLTIQDGINGQIRLAKLQAQQALQLARAQIKDKGKSGEQAFIGTDPDSEFFKCLSPAERKKLAPASEFHFGIVSARRATKVEGIRDILMVQMQLEEAGVTPTWYVDEASLADYKKLGLKAVVGGKLCPSRNKALKDATKLGKVCVQVSDDISAWEYREGKKAENRTDDAVNAAHAAARRYIVSPVAAARFVLAKMRSAEGEKPKLGGVYMLGSCSRSFAGDAFSRHHFILGDFFVVDKGSKVLFDETMKLKEDYDFACAHIKAHGSVMRCNRMTLNVKHYANEGGAVTNRDGTEEKRNIAILQKKWPGCFRPNPKRKNEIIMRWKGQPEDEDTSENTKPKSGLNKSSPKKSLTKVMKKLDKKRSLGPDLRPTAVLKLTGKVAKAPNIAARCKKVAGHTIEQALGMKCSLSSGEACRYKLQDLKYDLFRGFLSTK
eukprot:TRINITY_DN3084_c1_g1_i2.p1 TRINITY_DN3084_c1_g1~~TRINITY_DN3084_c1_g1_i2.p1  ORF type:complete len:616 (-),score=137.48 TRINITY_DN3084_c1_g1_i2:248-1951(-)